MRTRRRKHVVPPASSLFANLLALFLHVDAKLPQVDLAVAIEELRKREGLSFKAALNQVIRLGMQAKSAPPKAKKYRTPTKALGLKPGIDPVRLNALVDELATDAYRDQQD